MLNIMSYVGMSLQSEVCMWTLVGLVRTIFDATLFKVNANLKQVWQMKMPPQLSTSVQRMLRTMVSGVMLVQCFTLYVYIAFYIVLLYPVFLEEKPTLVLPWLLLAAVRKLLCELMSLALGLFTCVLVGPARPACVRFLITKVITIASAFYVWILVFSYYHTLILATAFKTFPAVMPPSDRDFGLELAVRRRRTKSLFGEDQLRRKIKAGLYAERSFPTKPHHQVQLKFNETVSTIPLDNGDDNIDEEASPFQTAPIYSGRIDSDSAYEDCVCNDVTIPRDTDRILEQFVTMSLRVATYLKKDGMDSSKFLDSLSIVIQNKSMGLDCNTLSNENSEPPQVAGSNQSKLASYLTEYPQIFMKKMTDRNLIVDANEVVNRVAENKAAGSNDTISAKKSILFREKSTYIELDDSKDSQSASQIISVGENITGDYKNKAEKQTTSREIDKHLENLSSFDLNINKDNHKNDIKVENLLLSNSVATILSGVENKSCVSDSNEKTSVCDVGDSNEKSCDDIKVANQSQNISPTTSPRNKSKSLGDVNASKNKQE